MVCTLIIAFESIIFKAFRLYSKMLQTIYWLAPSSPPQYNIFYTCPYLTERGKEGERERGVPLFIGAQYS